MSSACKRYYAPLRLPARPGSISAAPYTSPLSVPAHPAGSPVVPSGAVPACHPCYPGGPQMTRQRWWSPGHRSSPSGIGVDALTELTRLHLGSLHATACEVAHVCRTRSSGNSVPWVTPHTSLELPGRAARSRGRTSTGESQSIHGILSGTFFTTRASRTISKGYSSLYSKSRIKYGVPGITLALRPALHSPSPSGPQLILDSGEGSA